MKAFFLIVFVPKQEILFFMMDALLWNQKSKGSKKNNINNVLNTLMGSSPQMSTITTNDRQLKA